jgi:ElaB/YqjD/DUF883 family membrane-anchored ribosome-binding protein
MDDQPEVIRHQMEETRASLSEKLETLEQQVTGTVKDARAAVTETVESVKEAVRDTVDSVKETFDLHVQVMRRPWTMLGASVVVGYLGGSLLGRDASRSSDSTLSGSSRRGESYRPLRKTNGLVTESKDENVSMERSLASSARASEPPGWLGQVATSFQPELTMLKGVAVGTLLGLVRDYVNESAPEGLRPKIKELVDNVTVKLGGEPLQSPILEKSSTEPFRA